MLVCVMAAALAALRIIASRLWQNPGDLVYVVAGGAAMGGTVLVVAIPALHRPTVGLVWSAVCLALATAVFYRPLFQQLGSRRSAILLGLRMVVIGLLVLMLFEPVIRYTAIHAPERPLFLLVDTSGSMSVPDVQNGPTRIQSVWQALQPQLPLLRQHFDVRVRTFASEVKALDRPEDLADLPADGKTTDIVKGAQSILGESSRKDAAIVLISDGIDNASPDVAKVVARSLRPIHTLSVGSEQTQSSAVQNIAIESVEADDELAVGHETKLKVTVLSTGLANRVVDVKWAQLGSDGKPMGEGRSQKLVLEPSPAGQKLELAFKPTTIGLQRIAVWVDPIPGERTTIDNRQEFQALAMDPRIKVLYVEGRARPEYRDLKRALDRDANIEAASLLRIQQDRFAASGTVDGEKVATLPVTSEAWRKFDVIILGDLDVSFLTRPQQIAIEQAVSEGSGLLMVGGQSSFGPGSYAGTPIEKLLPVMVGGTDAAQEKSQFVPRLTAEGVMHPAMEGLTQWFGVGDKAGTRELPPIRGNVVVSRPKTGATVLLVHEGKAGPDGKAQIVLATQNYGKGRSGAFTADTTYLWYLPLRGMGQESPYNLFWGQLVRWLAGVDVKNRQQGAGMDGMLNRSVYESGEAVLVKAMVRDERGDATRYATVQMELKKPDGTVAQRLNLSPAETRVGLYEMRLPDVEAGDWQIHLTGTKDGKQLGDQALKFTVIAPADELLQLGAKPQLMAEIAQKTKGYSYALAQLPQLVNQLIGTDLQGSPVSQAVVPLANVLRWLPAMLGQPTNWATRYDLPLQAVIVISLLMAEWLLRRRWQVA